MTSKPDPTLQKTILTTTILIEQFLSSLSNTNKSEPVTASETPSPLVLLDAAATAIKSQTTKISLLTITAPFTPSALVNCLKPLNESILPSLVTASLLTTPTLYTTGFSTECRTSSSTLLHDLQTLIRQVETRNNVSKPTQTLSETEKKAITEQTGRVWSGCDSLAKLGKEGLAGYVARKANQWLELMKDAVKELQEWDPEDEVDPDDIFGQVGSDDDDDDEEEQEEEKTDKEDHRATISAGVKDQVLKVLNRIPQSIHVVVKQRLEKVDGSPGEIPSTEQRKMLNVYLTRIRAVSEMIDESAEAMYMGNPELCLKKAGEARATTVEIVQSARNPLSSGVTNGKTKGKEDLYIERALEWIQKVDVGSVDPGKTASPE